MRQKVSDASRRNRVLRAGKVVVLVVLTASAAIHGYFLAQGNVFADLDPTRPATDEIRREAAQQYAKQSDRFADWALAVLVGIVAVTVTSKVHEVKYCDYVFLCLGPSGAFLLMSMRAGWEFERRLANMIVHADMGDIDSLAALVADQSDLFLGGLVLAMLFGFWYLGNIVAGDVQPHD